MLLFLPACKLIIPEAVGDRLKQIIRDKLKRGRGCFKARKENKKKIQSLFDIVYRDVHLCMQ